MLFPTSPCRLRTRREQVERKGVLMGSGLACSSAGPEQRPAIPPAAGYTAPTRRAFTMNLPPARSVRAGRYVHACGAVRAHGCALAAQAKLSNVAWRTGFIETPAPNVARLVKDGRGSGLIGARPQSAMRLSMLHGISASAIFRSTQKRIWHAL
jgi:hypothetical protein